MAFHEGLACELKHIYKAPGVMTSLVTSFFATTNMTRADKPRVEPKLGEMMEPEVISEAILEQILSCRGGHLFIPSWAAWFSGIRGLPNWLQETIRDMFASVLNREAS